MKDLRDLFLISQSNQKENAGLKIEAININFSLVQSSGSFSVLKPEMDYKQ
jgi:hypothetical protein